VGEAFEDVLVVDDEEDDVAILRAVLERAPPALRIRSIGSSAAFLAELEDPRSRVPGLLLLDLNLPGWDGRHVLRRIRDSPRWGATAVIVFSGSDLERDVADCYRLGANAYVVKPRDLEGYRRVCRAIDSFWLGAARRARTASPDDAAGG